MLTARLAMSQDPPSTRASTRRERPPECPSIGVQFDSFLHNEAWQSIRDLESAKTRIAIRTRPRLAHFRDVLAAIERRQRAIHAAERAQLEMRWLREHQVEHAGRWVALIGNNLLAAASSAREAFAAVRNAPEVPLIVRVESPDEPPFAGW